MAKAKKDRNCKRHKVPLHICPLCCGKGKTRKKVKVRKNKGRPSTNPMSYFFQYVHRRLKAMETNGCCGKGKNQAPVTGKTSMIQAGSCWKKLSEEQKADFIQKHCPRKCRNRKPSGCMPPQPPPAGCGGGTVSSSGAGSGTRGGSSTAPSFSEPFSFEGVRTGDGLSNAPSFSGISGPSSFAGVGTGHGFSNAPSFSGPSSFQSIIKETLDIQYFDRPTSLPRFRESTTYSSLRVDDLPSSPNVNSVSCVSPANWESYSSFGNSEYDQDEEMIDYGPDLDDD